MAPKKRPPGEGISKLIRDASSFTKKQIELRDQEAAQAEENGVAVGELIVDELRPFRPKIFNILEYIEQSWGLGMKLFPAQRFLVKLYYNIPLEDKIKTIEIKDMLGTKLLYRFTELEYLHFLYSEGRCNIKEQDRERRQLILSIGRRAGKTTLSAVFASYEVYRLLNLYNPQQYYGFPNGNRIQIISVATDKEQAGILFNEVTTHLAKCDYFKQHIANNTLSHIQFRTPYDIEKFGPTSRHQNGKFTSFNGKATLRVTFKSCVAKGLRGHSNAVVIMDEMAHYQSEGQSSAKDIYDAVTPSTATYSPKDPETGMPMLRSDGTEYPVESRVIAISSPLNRTGKFYELFHHAMSNAPGSANMLAIQAPTWELNPTVPADYYQQKYHEDPIVFLTEHGAEFSDRVRAWIEREQDLMGCVDPEHRPVLVGVPRYPYQMGIDIGLVGDATSVSITGCVNGKVELVYHEMWKAGEDWRVTNPHLGMEYSTNYCKTLANSDRIEFDEISEWIWRLTKRFYITDGIFDRWNGIPLEQALLKRGLSQFKSEHFTPDLSSRIYQNTKMLMFDRSLRLYNYPVPEQGKKHSFIINELLTLQAQQRSKNIIIVEAPDAAGFHDDFSDSFVRAAWLTSERMRNEKFVYGNSQFSSGGLAPAMTARRYQMMRARSHGGFGDRPGGMSGRRVAFARPRGVRGVR
jgi:hypothetical protein